MQVKFSTLGKRKRKQILMENRGLLAQVAHALRVDISAVSRVYWGKSTSRRIATALEDKLESILTQRQEAAA